MKYALILAPFLVSLAVFACSGGGDDETDSPPPTATAEPELTAEDVLEMAAEASAAVESFHFVLTHENGSSPLPLGLELIAAEGDVVVPDGLKAEVDAEAVGINVTVDVIGLDGRTWITNPFTRNWEELDGTNIQDFANPEALLSELLPAIENAELGEGSRVDGVDTRMVMGTIDSGALSSALGIARPGQEVRVESWIGVEDDLPRRVRLIGPLSSSDNENVVRQVDLSNFDQPVSIEPPE